MSRSKHRHEKRAAAKKMRFWSVATRGKEWRERAKKTRRSPHILQYNVDLLDESSGSSVDLTAFYKTSLVTVHAKQKLSLVGRSLVCSRFERMETSTFQHANLFEANFSVSSTIDEIVRRRKKRYTHRDFKLSCKMSTFPSFVRFVVRRFYSQLNKLLSNRLSDVFEMEIRNVWRFADTLRGQLTKHIQKQVRKTEWETKEKKNVVTHIFHGSL